MTSDKLKNQLNDLDYLILFLSNSITFAKREKQRMGTPSGNFQSESIIKDLETRLHHLETERHQLVSQFNNNVR